MDSAIPISTINDFLFCPKSLYLHSIYISFDISSYHDSPQTIGRISHENIENESYTTSKHILQALSVYSAYLGVKGKIDIFDSKRGYLIERKYRVKSIYKGFRYQLYAQMYCLEELGYKVKKLFIQSLSDNKRYEIPMPTQEERKEFEDTILKMKSFDADSINNHACSHCLNNIYGLLNW
jgi:CRISPR-associated exonuclease Cas4